MTYANNADHVLGGLRKAVLGYDVEAGVSWAKKAIQEGIDPIVAIDSLGSAMREVGDAFHKGECWLPEVVGATEVVNGAMPILQEEVKNRGLNKASRGTIIAGTVHGDIHETGKALVCALWTSAGFTVHDLGSNVTAEEFVAAIRKHNAGFLAMSSFLTTTGPYQKLVIDLLKKEGLRASVKIMSGGGAVNQQFADSIGADGYAPTAPEAVKLIEGLLGKKGDA